MDEPNDTPENPLAAALEQDLRRLGIQQQDLPAMLAVDGEYPITASAISAWKNRGVIPARRLPKIIEILGEDSAVSKLVRQGLAPIPAPRPRPAMAQGLVRPGETFGAFRQRISTRLSEFSTSRELLSLLQALPEEFHGNVDRKVTLGSIEKRFDYLSDKVALEVKRTMSDGSPFSSTYARLIKLLALKAVQGIAPPDAPRQYVLALLPPDREKDPGAEPIAPGRARFTSMRLGELLAECSLLGVTLLIHTPMEQVAQVVVDIENDTFGQEPPYDYDE